MDLQCVVCGEKLLGGLDTYGDADQRLCEPCWLQMHHEIEMADPYHEGVIYICGVEDTLLLLRQIQTRRECYQKDQIPLGIEE